MGMDSLNTFVNLVALGFGVYALYVVVKLGSANKLFPNQLLVPKDRSVSDCLDEETYVAYMKPRTMVLGIALILEGAFAILNDKLGLLQTWFGNPEGMTQILLLEVPVVMALIVIVWYGVVLTRAQRAYWP